MHELGWCEGLLEAVQRRAGGRRVRAIRVRAGALHRIEPDALQQGFELVAAGTVADRAVVEVTVVPVRTFCPDCGVEAEAPDCVPACPRCGSAAAELRGGDELVLESVRYASGGHGQGG